MRTLMQIAEDARRSKYAVAKLGTNDKNRGILAIADTLMAHAPRLAPEKRPSVMRATVLSSFIPARAEVGLSISRIPGPPLGPS